MKRYPPFLRVILTPYFKSGNQIPEGREEIGKGSQARLVIDAIPEMLGNPIRMFIGTKTRIMYDDLNV